MRTYLDHPEIEQAKARGLEVHVFTFGWGQQHQGRCQVILAKDWFEARNLMFSAYGKEWSFQYGENEWRSVLNAEACGEMFSVEKPLENLMIQRTETQWKTVPFVEVDHE